MKRQIKVLAMCIAFLTVGMTQTGCSVFGKMFKKKKSYAQKRREKRAKYEKMAKAKYDVISKQKGCKGLKEGYKKIYRYAGGTMARQTKTAVHLAKCGYWSEVFGRYSRSNQRWVNNMMDALVAAKLPVQKEYKKWLTSTPVPYKSSTGWYAFTFTRNWLAKSDNPKQFCQVMWDSRERATKRLYPKYRWRIRSMMIGYLNMAKCKSFKSKISSLLTSNSWRDRNQACLIMKEWGTSSDLRKIRILAQTDSYSFIRRRVRVYPVRTSCRAAMGRVQMRN